MPIGLEHAEALRAHDRLRAGFRRQLLKDPLQMRLDRLGSDAQLSGYLLVRPAAGDELDDRALAGCQLVRRSGLGRRLARRQTLTQLRQ